MDVAVGVEIILGPPPFTEEGLILTAPAKQEAGPTLNLAQVIAECQESGQRMEQLLAHARGYAAMRQIAGEVEIPAGKSAAQIFAKHLADLHGTTLTREELFIIWRIHRDLIGAGQLIDLASLGEELATLRHSEDSTWQHLPFATWRDEVTLRQLTLGGATVSGTRFI